MIEDKFYLTKQGLEKIKQEYKNLLLLKQEKIHTETPVAFHSEELDTEFVAFKEDIELLEVDFYPKKIFSAPKISKPKSNSKIPALVYFDTLLKISMLDKYVILP